MTIAANLDAAATRYSEAKFSVEQWTGASQDLLHVHFGLAIFVLTALLFRRRMRSPIPLAFVAIFAALNELVDWWNGQEMGNGEPLFDFLNTVFWPAVLFAIARRWR